MEALLPSEIARLVLGYLEEQKCTDAAKVFLETCPHLQECRSVVSSGRRFSTRVNGLTLMDIIEKFSAASAMVQERLNKVIDSEQRRPCGDLLEQLKFLVEETRSQRFVVNINVPSQNNQSQNGSPIISGSIRKRHHSNSERERSKRATRSNVDSAQRLSEPITSQVEATPLESLPGTIGFPKDSEQSHNVDREESSGISLEHNYQKSLNKNPIDGPRNESLNKNPIDGPRNEKDIEIQTQISSETASNKRDCQIEHLTNINILEKCTMATSTEELLSLCNTEVQTNPYEILESESEMNDDPIENLSLLTKELLNRTELQERIAEKINKAILPLDTSMKDESFCSESAVVNDLNSSLIMTNLNIKSIVKATESDPAFETFLDEIFGQPADTDTSPDEDAESRPCDDLNDEFVEESPENPSNDTNACRQQLSATEPQQRPTEGRGMEIPLKQRLRSSSRQRAQKPEDEAPRQKEQDKEHTTLEDHNAAAILSIINANIVNHDAENDGETKDGREVVSEQKEMHESYSNRVEKVQNEMKETDDDGEGGVEENKSKKIVMKKTRIGKSKHDGEGGKEIPDEVVPTLIFCSKESIGNFIQINPPRPSLVPLPTTSTSHFVPIAPKEPNKINKHRAETVYLRTVKVPAKTLPKTATESRNILPVRPIQQPLRCNSELNTRLVVGEKIDTTNVNNQIFDATEHQQIHKLNPGENSQKINAAGTSQLNKINPAGNPQLNKLNYIENQQTHKLNPAGNPQLPKTNLVENPPINNLTSSENPQLNKLNVMESITLYSNENSAGTLLESAHMSAFHVDENVSLSGTGLSPYLKFNCTKTNQSLSDIDLGPYLENTKNLNQATTSGAVKTFGEEEQLSQTELIAKSGEEGNLSKSETIAKSGEEGHLSKMPEKPFGEEGNFSKTEMIAKRTPRTLLKSRSKNHRLSLSTPRRRSSGHVRALDFSTPTKSSSSRKSSANENAQHSPRSARNSNSMCRTSLFKSPPFASTTSAASGKSVKSPLRVCKSSFQLPVATRCPAPKLQGGWDKYNGIGVIIGEVSPRKEIASKPEARKPLLPKTSWDADLRKCIQVEQEEKPKPVKKRPLAREKLARVKASKVSETKVKGKKKKETCLEKKRNAKNSQPEVTNTEIQVHAKSDFTGSAISDKPEMTEIQTHIKSNCTGNVNLDKPEMTEIHTHIKPNFTGNANLDKPEMTEIQVHAKSDFTGNAISGKPEMTEIQTHIKSNLTGNAIFGKPEVTEVQTHIKSNFTGDANLDKPEVTEMQTPIKSNFTGNANPGKPEVPEVQAHEKSNSTGNANHGKPEVPEVPAPVKSNSTGNANPGKPEVPEIHSPAKSTTKIVAETANPRKAEKPVVKKYAQLRTLKTNLKKLDDSSADFSLQKCEFVVQQTLPDMADLETPRKEKSSGVPPTPRLLSPNSSAITPFAKLSEDSSKGLRSFVSTPEFPTTPCIALTPTPTEENTAEKPTGENTYFRPSCERAEESAKTRNEAVGFGSSPSEAREVSGKMKDESAYFGSNSECKEACGKAKNQSSTSPTYFRRNSECKEASGESPSTSSAYFAANPECKEVAGKLEITQFEVIKGNLPRDEAARELKISSQENRAESSKDGRYLFESENETSESESSTSSDSSTSSSSSSSSSGSNASSSRFSARSRKTPNISREDTAAAKNSSGESEKMVGERLENNLLERKAATLVKYVRLEISPKKVFSLAKSDEQLQETRKETPAKDDSVLEANISETPSSSKTGMENLTNLSSKISALITSESSPPAKPKIADARPEEGSVQPETGYLVHELAEKRQRLIAKFKEAPRAAKIGRKTRIKRVCVKSKDVKAKRNADNSEATRKLKEKDEVEGKSECREKNPRIGGTEVEEKEGNEKRRRSFEGNFEVRDAEALPEVQEKAEEHSIKLDSDPRADFARKETAEVSKEKPGKLDVESELNSEEKEGKSETKANESGNCVEEKVNKARNFANQKDSKAILKQKVEQVKRDLFSDEENEQRSILSKQKEGNNRVSIISKQKEENDPRPKENEQQSIISKEKENDQQSIVSKEKENDQQLIISKEKENDQQSIISNKNENDQQSIISNRKENDQFSTLSSQENESIDTSSNIEEVEEPKELSSVLQCLQLVPACKSEQVMNLNSSSKMISVEYHFVYDESSSSSSARRRRRRYSSHELQYPVDVELSDDNYRFCSRTMTPTDFQEIFSLSPKPRRRPIGRKSPAKTDGKLTNDEKFVLKNSNTKPIATSSPVVRVPAAKVKKIPLKQADDRKEVVADKKKPDVEEVQADNHNPKSRKRKTSESTENKQCDKKSRTTDPQAHTALVKLNAVDLDEFLTTVHGKQ